MDGMVLSNLPFFFFIFFYFYIIYTLGFASRIALHDIALDDLDYLHFPPLRFLDLT